MSEPSWITIGVFFVLVSAYGCHTRQVYNRNMVNCIAAPDSLECKLFIARHGRRGY